MWCLNLWALGINTWDLDYCTAVVNTGSLFGFLLKLAVPQNFLRVPALIVS